MRTIILALCFLALAATAHGTITFFELGPPQMPEEQEMLRILKKRGLKKDVAFLSCPWAFTNKTEEALYLKKLKRLKLHDGCTVIGFFPDDPKNLTLKNIIPALKEAGISHIFTPSPPKRESIDGIHIISIPWLPRNARINGLLQQRKDILCSFVGSIKSHPIRRHIPKLTDIPGFYVKMNSTMFNNNWTAEDVKRMGILYTFKLKKRDF